MQIIVLAMPNAAILGNVRMILSNFAIHVVAEMVSQEMGKIVKQRATRVATF